MNETCAILFADQKSTIVSEIKISDSEKSEVVSRTLPSGSYWKIYNGGRSISGFPLASSNRFVLSYSVITESAVLPLISFIVLQEYDFMAAILQRRLIGIQSAYYRRMRRFFDLNETHTRLLATNISSLRVSRSEEIPNIKASKTKQPYKNALHWRVIENAIISLAINKKERIVDFCTLSLEEDNRFKLIGIAEESAYPQS